MNLVNKVEGFVYTTAIQKMRTLTKRIRGVPGGTSGGKTYGILPILIDQAARTPRLEISVVSETIPNLKKGANKDFIKIMQATNRWVHKHYNKTDMKYTFANGSYIEFFSADQPDKLRGPRRNILYVNECNNISWEAYYQLAIRTDQTIWLDFNPTHEFWYHEELLEDPDFEEIILTYLDNEALSPVIVKEIEKAKYKAYYDPDGDIFDEKNVKNKYWDNWWRVYGLGLTGSLEGVIFKQWEQVKEIPQNAILMGYGLDFGYTNDPTALVAAYKFNGDIYFDELIYSTGLLNQDIVDRMDALNVHRVKTIWADSAEPKSIAEIHRKKYNTKSVKKGKDSINFGIDILQQYNFKVTQSSLNIIKELRNYTWDEDKDGNTLNKPIDKYNHAMDAMRYFAMMELRTKPKRRLGAVKRTR